jgi:hypothetical protein
LRNDNNGEFMCKLEKMSQVPGEIIGDFFLLPDAMKLVIEVGDAVLLFVEASDDLFGVGVEGDRFAEDAFEQGWVLQSVDKKVYFEVRVAHGVVALALHIVAQG